MKRLLFLTVFLAFSCGEREDAEKIDRGLEGRWQSFEVKCHREIAFLKDQFFNEVARCHDNDQSHISTGIWSRSQDNVITMKYVESTNQHMDDVEIHAILDLDQDRVLLTNLAETIILRRVSNKPELGYPFPNPGKNKPTPKKPDDRNCIEIIVNNNNSNQNDNDNTIIKCQEST